MQNPIVQIEHLSHRYSRNWAIRDINLEISKTGVVGLLGSNGAGKSTTMNILCGVLNQTEGTVMIGGYDIRKQPVQAKKQLGFLPQNPPLYLDLTVDEYLTHCAHLRLMDGRAVKSSLEEVKKRCGITHFSKRLIKNLSGGYRQRVGIAQAIIHKPKLVVMDEPTNGLDPNQIVEVRALIKDIAAERAVIFSTHILSEVKLLCKEIKMIEDGRLIFSDTMDAFNNYIEPHTAIATMYNMPPEEELLKVGSISKVTFINDRQVRIFFDGDRDVTTRIVQKSVENNWHLSEIVLEKNTLDEVFAQLSGKYKA
ncbi:MAG: ABC transporter ATP-binding protein [Chitinophagaceae bacterium]|nr:ABC transporter ATP-binding protein [Chitinophagaceae bacterium]